MSVVICDYCNNDYTLRGINRHLRYCKEKALIDRKRLIEQLLYERGCKLRNDSKLCKAYIENNEGDPEEIAIIMEEMKFYIKKTNYYSELEEGTRAMIEYKGSFNLTEESWCAKSRALENWCNKYISITHIDFTKIPKSLHEDIIDIISNRTKKEQKHIIKNLHN